MDTHRGSVKPAPAPLEPPDRSERITATGWRLVGRAVSLVDEAGDEAGPQPERDDDVLYAARFRVRLRMGNASAALAVLAVLGNAVARDWSGAPPLTPDRPLRRAPGRFQGLRWQPSGGREVWNGELIWRHRHPVVAGVPCTTHVLLSEAHGQTQLTVRVATDGGVAAARGFVGAGQARPAFLTELHRAVRLAFDGGDGDPRLLTDDDINEFVHDVLLSETRKYPVAVIAPTENGEYLIQPSEIADELLGLAHVYMIDRHPATFRLSDALGDRRLSCYWGALRVYMPEFSCADRPEDHPLLTRERLLDPVIRAELVGRLARRLRGFVTFPAREPVEARNGSTVTPAPEPAQTSPASSAAPAVLQPGVAAVTNVAATADARAPEHAATTARPTSDDVTPDVLRAIAAMPATLGGLTATVRTLADAIAELAIANDALRDEVERLRTTNAVRAASNGSVERRLRGIEELLERQFAPAAEVTVARPDEHATHQGPDTAESDEDAESSSVLDVLRQAAVAHSEALLILDAAERSATDSPFEDTERLAVILDAMAAVARRRQGGALGTSLKDAFREIGIDYRGGISSSTSARQLQQYSVRGESGALYDCREHIVLGSTYDPRFCLRIYFTSRAPLEPRFVIGHVGRHFDVSTTS